MVNLPDRKIQDPLQLISIPAMQRLIIQKELESLAGKLHSMQIAVPGAVSHLYHIRRALAQEGEDRAWILSYFH